jgi:hypothetical protein
LIAAQEAHTDSLQVLVQTKADFDKATINDGATPASAVGGKMRTVSMQVVVHVFCNIAPELHELVLHI